MSQHEQVTSVSEAIVNVLDLMSNDRVPLEWEQMMMLTTVARRLMRWAENHSEAPRSDAGALDEEVFAMCDAYWKELEQRGMSAPAQAKINAMLAYLWPAALES